MLLYSVSVFAKEYMEVVQVPDKNADQLYSLAREWFAETFKSADDVLQMDDPVAGKLIGKGMGKGYHKGIAPIPFNYEFTVKVFVKDGKYKYMIDNIALVTNSIRTNCEDYVIAKAKFKNKKKKVAFFDNILNTIDSDMTNLIVTLNSKMKGVEDEW